MALARQYDLTKLHVVPSQNMYATERGKAGLKAGWQVTDAQGAYIGRVDQWYFPGAKYGQADQWGYFQSTSDTRYAVGEFWQAVSDLVIALCGFEAVKRDSFATAAWDNIF